MTTRRENEGLFAAQALVRAMSTGRRTAPTVRVDPGGQARYDPNTHTMYLPGIPKTGLDDDVMTSFRAYLDHEDGEAQITDWPRKMQRRHGRFPRVLARLVNAINDARVDAWKGKQYPGAGFNIRSRVERDYRDLLEAQKNDEIPDVLNRDAQAGLVGALARYIGEGITDLETVKGQFPQLKQALDVATDELERMPDLDRLSMDQLASSELEDLLIDIAENIYGNIQEMEPPTQPDPPEGEECEDGDEGEAGDADDEEDDESEGGGDGDDDETDDGDEESEGGGDGDDDETDDGDDESEGGGDGDDDETDDGDDESEGGGGGGDDEETEDDENDDGDGTAGGGDAVRVEVESDGDAGDSDGAAADADTDADADDAGDEPADAGSDAGDIYSDGDDFEWDTDENIRQEVTEGLKEDSGNHYIVNTNSDVHIDAEPDPMRAERGHENTRMYDRLGSNLASRLDQALHEPAKRWQGGRERGHIDRSRLHHLAAGRSNVMRRRIRQQAKDVAVALSIDESSSMTSRVESTEKRNDLGLIESYLTRAQVAEDMARVFNEALGRLDVPLGVYGWCMHGGINSREYYDRAMAEADSRMEGNRRYIESLPTRTTALRIRTLKGFDDDWRDARTKDTLASLDPAGGTPTGEGIEVAAEKLAMRPESKKILFVLTDGEPSMGEEHAEYIRKVQEECRRRGILVIVLAIGEATSDADPELFDNWTPVDDAGTLVQVASKKLVNMIRRGA